MKRAFSIITLIFIIALLAGCEGGVVVGGKSMGMQDGQFVRSSGYMVGSYPYPFDAVCQGIDDTLKEMKAVTSEKHVKIGKASIIATLQGEKVTFEVEFKEKNKTDVSILVGMGGSNIASQLIHDRLRLTMTKTAK
ncbi:MAG TPA: hypothetical protein DCG53_02725 [Syntrophus sp. (in: bacteria)]|jgi:glucose-6-phosphate isomerase|nr:hypothetical protein [Syntrophus sp. (in: bacteria)]